MKKIFLSITALTFGASVAFAQTTETGIQQEQNSDLQIEKLSNSAEEEGKKKIELGELPAAVQEAFKNSEFKDWEVKDIYEITPSGESQEMTSDAGIAPAGNEAAYEIHLISKDMKDEIADSQEKMAEVEEEAIEETAEADPDDAEEANVKTETVTVEVPAVVLQYDKDGNLVKQENQQGTN